MDRGSCAVSCGIKRPRLGMGMPGGCGGRVRPGVAVWRPFRAVRSGAGCECQSSSLLHRCHHRRRPRSARRTATGIRMSWVRIWKCKGIFWKKLEAGRTAVRKRSPCGPVWPRMAACGRPPPAQGGAFPQAVSAAAVAASRFPSQRPAPGPQGTGTCPLQTSPRCCIFTLQPCGGGAL